MGFEDYNNGWFSPNTPADLRDPNWLDYEKGQADRKKMMGMGTPSSSGSSAPAPSGPQLPPRPYPARRKHMFIGLLAPLFAGPLGLFYASKKAGAVMLAAVGAAYFAATHGIPSAHAGLPAPPNAPHGFIIANVLVQPEDVWILGGLISVVWSVLLVFLHNRRAAATDAANQVAWQAEADRILAAKS